MRTRITFLIRDLGYGGAQRQLVALATGLPQNEFAVSVLHFYPGPLETELRTAGVRTVCVQKKSRWDLVGFFVRLVRAARAEKPDILHGYLTESNLMTALLKPFLRGVRIIWGLRDSQSDAHLWGMLGRLSFRISCLLSNRADKIIANSAAGRDYYVARKFPAHKISVIPNGIDIDRFRPDAAAGATLRGDWHLPPDAFVFGCVGRMNPMKDHATLLRAFALVSASHPRARLVCVGGGDDAYRAEMRQLAAKLGISGNVLWLEPGRDMTTVYNALDALVSASAFAEGFSNVIAEAMACGLPCAVTEVGDSAQIIADTGFTAPASQPEALAAAISGLLGIGPAAMPALKARVRTRIVENFSVPQLVSRTREVFLQLTATEQPAPLQKCMNASA